MWLVGVVIRRYIDILIIIINFPYSNCIRSFFGSSILTSLFIFKCFFGLIYMDHELPRLLAHIGDINRHILHKFYLAPRRRRSSARLVYSLDLTYARM